MSMAMEYAAQGRQRTANPLLQEMARIAAKVDSRGMSALTTDEQRVFAGGARALGIGGAAVAAPPRRTAPTPFPAPPKPVTPAPTPAAVRQAPPPPPAPEWRFREVQYMALRPELRMRYLQVAQECAKELRLGYTPLIRLFRPALRDERAAFTDPRERLLGCAPDGERFIWVRDGRLPNDTVETIRHEIRHQWQALQGWTDTAKRERDADEYARRGA
jgi:hypothetical protein